MIAAVSEGQPHPAARLFFRFVPPTREQAHAIDRRTLPAGHPSWAEDDAAVGRYRTALGQYDQALAALRAAATQLQGDPLQRPRRVEVDTTIAAALRGQGKHDEAIALLDPVEHTTVTDEVALPIAGALVELAQTLAAADRDPDRVRALARRARALATDDHDIEHQVLRARAERLRTPP